MVCLLGGLTHLAGLGETPIWWVITLIKNTPLYKGEILRNLMHYFSTIQGNAWVETAYPYTDHHFLVYRRDIA